MHTHDDVPTDAPKQVGRRAIARGAAWSVPVVALAVAAPASAATSGCQVVTGMLVWKNLSSGNLLNKNLTTTVAGLTLRVTVTGDTGADDNGVRSTGPVGGAHSLLLLHSENDDNNTTQTITLKFSAPVQNLQFSLLDIDSSRDKKSFGSGYTNHYQDKISVLPAPSGQTRGSTVTGSGTTASPWRAVNQDNPVTDDSTTGNVALSWSSSLDTVTIVYSQDGSQDGSPKVGIGDISFQTVC